ncbi:hypothetical protein NDU88_002073 [Pleurodeles waltl]|uniref:Uncharacterized protein n=1 Tax=Pleurodeles waltl TaxID=8319 RepID=A0AAV7UA77_PLEWA|nr:hypothetical protein NDU88_002073 [Pleurodeles waltl]
MQPAISLSHKAEARNPLHACALCDNDYAPAPFGIVKKALRMDDVQIIPPPPRKQILRTPTPGMQVEITVSNTLNRVSLLMTTQGQEGGHCTSWSGRSGWSGHRPPAPMLVADGSAHTTTLTLELALVRPLQEQIEQRETQGQGRAMLLLFDDHQQGRR